MIKKMIKISIISIISIIVIISLLLIILVNFVNPNQFKPAIVKSVDITTGRHLLLDGNISWKIYPRIGLNINKFSLSNPVGFTQQNFISGNSMYVSVDLWPLLNKNIIVNNITIDGLNLELIKQHGMNNWTFNSSQSEPSAIESNTSSPSPLSLELNHFSLTNANIKYSDLDKNIYKKLENFKFIVDTEFGGTIKFDQLLDKLELHKVNINFNDDLNGKINLDVVNLNNPSYSGDISTNQFSLNKMVDSLGMSKLPIVNPNIFNKVAFSANFAGGSNFINLSQIKFNLTDSILNGDINITSFKPLMLNNNITLSQVDISDFINVNGFKIPLRQIKLNGNIMTNGNNIATLNAKQNLQIQNITLLGISLDQLVQKLDGIINKTGHLGDGDISTIVSNSAQVVQSVHKMQEEVKNTLKPSSHDLLQKTNLGTLHANLNLKNGVANSSSFSLNGSNTIITGSGQVDLNKNNLNYVVQSKLLVSGINPIFKKMVFPSRLSGAINDINVAMDWASIQKQLISYIIDNNKQQIGDKLSQEINDRVTKQVSPEVKKQVDDLSKKAGNALKGLFDQ